MPYISLKQIPDVISWHEGMLLTPEHFEELTFRQEDLLQYHAASHPFNWGVSRLAVDETQLMQGRFALLDLEALMPDGLPIWVDTRGLSHPALDLESLEASFRQQPFLVYLAAVAHESSAKSERDLRYAAVSDGEETQGGATDEEGETGETAIPRLRPRFHLIASHTALSEKYVSMPIARVGFRNNVWALMDDYVYPLQRVSEDSLVGRQCAGTLRRVRELALMMQDQWRNFSAQERLETQRDQPLVVRSLVAGLPLCEALLSAQVAHPFQLYLAFCTLAGHISGIASEPVPPVFQTYNHSDLIASFAEVLRYIDKVLSESDSHEYLGIPFRYKDGIFSLLFDPEWQGKHLILELRAQKEHESTLAAWCESALIGSRKLQESMRERRVLGANRSRTLSERGLFSGAGTVLFHLDEDNGYILPEEPLDIASGPASERSHTPVEVTLYIYRGK
ncbi:MAG: type VI secretion system baseplate subunit TssK [Edaphobacter sp.]